MGDLVSVHRPAAGEAAQPSARSSFGVLLVVMLALAGLIGLSSPAGAAPARTLVLAPNAGPASSTVTASGAGFKKRTPVEIYLDSSRVATVTTDGAGAFGAASFTVPAATPGAHVVSAREDGSTKKQAVATFTALSPAQVTITPPSGDYGTVVVDTAGATQTFTVTNSGQAASGPVLPQLTGANAADFTIAATTCTTLAGGTSCTIDVTFNPTGAGTKTASIGATATPGRNASATLTGTALSPALLTITPPSCNYGTVVVGATGATETFTVTNSGQAASGPVLPQLTGANAADFTIATTTCTTTLTGGATCTIDVTFSPTAVGGRTATISAAATPGGSATANLVGSGVAAVTVSPTGHNFGNQRLEAGPTEPTSFVITNNTTGTLVAVDHSNTNAADFPIAFDTCAGASLAPGASCSLSVSFDPTTAGSKSSTIAAAFADSEGEVQSVSFAVTDNGFVPPPDLATSIQVVSSNFATGVARVTVTNLGADTSVPATMTIDVSPVQSFSHSAFAGADCTAEFLPSSSISRFTCPVPSIAAGGTTTRNVNVSNLSGQAPRYLQISANTVMPGDTNFFNNRAGTTVVSWCSADGHRFRRLRRPPRATVTRMPPTSRRPDRNLAMELVRVTESAALAASRWVGRGDKNGADGAAVAAMRTVLSTVTMDGVVVIGEGEKDDAPMLFNGEQVGDGTPPLVDVAVDPIDGTTLTAQGRTNALAVIAVSDRESMFDPGPSYYMEKIAVGPEAVGSIDITASPTQNLRWIAKAKRESVRDLTVVILDRPRHAELIDEVRASGARIRLITDGDVYGSIAAGSENSGVDVLMGVGGTPEGVISAAALKCMGGELQGRLWPRDDEERAAITAAGLDPSAVLTTDDLVRGDNCFFAATGITDGPLLDGVRFDARGVTTQSLVMRSRSGTVRRIDAHHQIAKLQEYSDIDYT